MTDPDLDGVLREACRLVALSPDRADLLRSASNTLYRIPGGVVVRIARAGRLAISRKEVEVARWLHAAGVPSAEPLSGIEQPVEVAGRPVTFWVELPANGHGSQRQLGRLLRCLHELTPPTDVCVEPIDPFGGLTTWINQATAIGVDDQVWLRSRLAVLRERYSNVRLERPACLLHGDAWIGNVLVRDDGVAVLTDLESCAVGPREWDLVPTALYCTSFRWARRKDYAGFCEQYGEDVTKWAEFETFRDVREFLMTCWLASWAEPGSAEHEEVMLRLACLRGDRGPRPWPWTPVS